MGARQSAQEHERQHAEAQAELERIHAGDRRAPSGADKVLLESLEHQFNDARQQLKQLHGDQYLSTMEGQLAAQQTQVNEQLKALQHECNAMREAAEKAVAEHDATHRDTARFCVLSLRLQAAVRGSQPTIARDSESH